MRTSNSSTVRPSRAGLVAALALVALGGSAFGATPQTTQSEAEATNTNYCLQVKNPIARDTCQAARAQYYSANYLASLTLMTKAIEASPKEGILRALNAKIMIGFSHLGNAERELYQARKDGAPDLVVLPSLFGIMIARHEEMRLLNEFPEPAPGTKRAEAAIILRGRAMAFQSSERFDEAKVSMDRALSLVRDPIGLLLRADIASKQKDTALASKLVDEAYRMAPKDNAVMLAKLAQMEQSNDMAGAVALSDQILKTYTFGIEPRLARIRIFLKQNQDAKAKAEVDLVQFTQPGLFYKAVLLSRAHDNRGAAQIIMNLRPEFVRKNPQFALQMAQIMLDNGNVEQSGVILGAALSATPDLLEARLRLANLRLSQNSPQSALVLLTPVQDSPDLRVRKLLAQVRGQIAKNRAF